MSMEKIEAIIGNTAENKRVIMPDIVRRPTFNLGLQIEWTGDSFCCWGWATSPQHKPITDYEDSDAWYKAVVCCVERLISGCRRLANDDWAVGKDFTLTGNEAYQMYKSALRKLNNGQIGPSVPHDDLLTLCYKDLVETRSFNLPDEAIQKIVLNTIFSQDETLLDVLSDTDYGKACLYLRDWCMGVKEGDTPTLWRDQVAEAYIDQYVKHDGSVIRLSKGEFGIGDWILFCDYYNTIVIKEHRVGRWESAQSITTYKTPPKEIDKIIDGWCDDEIDDDFYAHDGVAVWKETGKPVRLP